MVWVIFVDRNSSITIFFFVKFWRLPEAKGVHQPLPHTGQPPAVHSLQLDKVAKRQTPKTRCWKLKYFLCSPRMFGEMIEFDDHIFQMGCFNHQPENHAGDECHDLTRID